MLSRNTPSPNRRRTGAVVTTIVTIAGLVATAGAAAQSSRLIEIPAGKAPAGHGMETLHPDDDARAPAAPANEKPPSVTLTPCTATGAAPGTDGLTEVVCGGETRRMAISTITPTAPATPQ